MKIERNTKAQGGSGVLTTSIPNIISEIMGIEKGTPLVWSLTDEGKVIVQKETPITRIDFTINIHKADTDDVGETIRFFFTFNEEGDITDWKSVNPLKGSEVDYLHFCDGWSSDDPSLVETLIEFLQKRDVWIVDVVVTNDPQDVGVRYETVFRDCIVTVEIVDIDPYPRDYTDEIKEGAYKDFLKYENSHFHFDDSIRKAAGKLGIPVKILSAVIYCYTKHDIYHLRIIKYHCLKTMSYEEWKELTMEAREQASRLIWECL